MTVRGDGAHASGELLERYAAGDAGIGPDTLWALEAHLEACAACRGGLRADVSPGVTSILERVRAGLDIELARTPRAPARRRWLPRSFRWTAPTLLRWLAMTGLVVTVALGFDVANQAVGSHYPSLVLLLAPVAPLLGVAAAWSRRTDPAYELVSATPRAGLYLVLRRTLAVLVAVIPVLAAAGSVVDASPARWLLPCLAFTVATLALGSIVGVPRAAAGLAVTWAVAVVTPSLVTTRPPVVLEPRALPAWAALTAAVVVVLAVRRSGFSRLPSGR